MLNRNILTILAGAMLLATSMAAQSPAQQDQQKPVTVQSDTALYVCPMHPKVTSSKPAECSICGMDLVLNKKDASIKKRSVSTTKKKQVKEATMRTTRTKEQLITAGEYNCCIKKPCDECFTAHGSCNCRENVKAKKSVCEECGMGWKRGEGNVSGVNPDSVSGTSHKH